MDEPIVGRNGEFARAAELIALAKAGSEAVYCLEAGPGMGKTLLAQRIVERARQEGLFVLSGAFVDGQDLPPLWPWRKMLKKASRYLESSDSTVADQRGQEAFLSSFERPWEEIPELSRLPEAERKYRVFELIGEFLHVLALDVPIALVLEDLHGGDDASLHLLTYLADVLQFDPVFLLLTWRPADDRRTDRIEALKQTVRFLPSTTIASPAPFSRVQLRQYLTALKISADDAELDHVLAWTDGVPLRAWLYAQHVASAPVGGGVAKRRAGRNLTAIFWDDLRTQLSQSACETARRLALLGNAFSEEEVRLVCSPEEDGTPHSVLRELIAHGLLRFDSDPSTYRFFHDEFRVSVLESIDKRELGTLIAETAAAVAGTTEDARRTRLLKELYLSAVDHGRGTPGTMPELEEAAIEFATAAITAALQQNAWREVVIDAERLLNLLEDRMEAEEVLELKTSLCVASHYSRTQELFYNPMAVKLLAALRTRGDIDRYCTVLCNYHFFGYAEGFTNIDEPWEYLFAHLAPEDPRRGRALLRYSEEQMTFTDDLQRSADIIERAIAFAREIGDPLTEAAAIVEMATIDVYRRRFESALEGVGKVSSDPIAMQTSSIRTKVVVAVMMANLGLGRMDAAREAGRKAISLEKLYDDPRLRGCAQFAKTRFPLMQGRWSQLNLDLSAADAAASSFYVLPAVVAAYLRGEIEFADRYVSEFIERGRRYGVARIQSTVIAVSWMIGVRAYLTGGTRWVDETLAMVMDFVETERPPLIALANLPVGAARMSRVSPIPEKHARGLYALLLENDQYYFEEEEYTCAAAKALLALTWRDHALAVQHFEEAIALCDKYGETPWRAHYLLELALLLPPSERLRAERHVRESASEAQRLGLKPLLERIDREWSPAAAATDFPAVVSITRRERQVLDCLVEGLTDKEIAAILNISPYTVGNHLRNIYTKTQSANRGEAVHWALANNLATVKPAQSAVDRDPPE